MSTPAGAFTYLYDGAQRMVSLTNPFAEVSGWSYLDNDWLWTQTLGNGAYSTRTYNALGQVVRAQALVRLHRRRLDLGPARVGRLARDAGRDEQVAHDVGVGATRELHPEAVQGRQPVDGGRGLAQRLPVLGRARPQERAVDVEQEQQAQRRRSRPGSRRRAKVARHPSRSP